MCTLVAVIHPAALFFHVDICAHTIVTHSPSLKLSVDRLVRISCCVVMAVVGSVASCANVMNVDLHLRLITMPSTLSVTRRKPIPLRLRTFALIQSTSTPYLKLPERVRLSRGSRRIEVIEEVAAELKPVLAVKNNSQRCSRISQLYLKPQQPIPADPRVLETMRLSKRGIPGMLKRLTRKQQRRPVLNAQRIQELTLPRLFIRKLTSQPHSTSKASALQLPVALSEPWSKLPVSPAKRLKPLDEAPES
jgi:hypothetical protein